MKKIALILLLSFVACFLFGCFNSKYEFIIPDRDRKSYTVSELEAIYIAHEAEFTDVGDLILSNDELANIMSNSKEWVATIETESKKNLFSEGDWEKIVKLFQTTGLFRIERNYKLKKELVRFMLGSDDKTTTTLYYCPGSEGSDLLYYSQREDIFNQIDDCWWIAFSTDER